MGGKISSLIRSVAGGLTSGVGIVHPVAVALRCGAVCTSCVAVLP